MPTGSGSIRAETLGEQTLRLLPPAGGWPTATLHIEERAGFESDGTRPRPEVVEPHHTAWFRLAKVEVTAEPRRDLTLPEVTWARESTLQASRIEAPPDGSVRARLVLHDDRGEQAMFARSSCSGTTPTRSQDGRWFEFMMAP